MPRGGTASGSTSAVPNLSTNPTIPAAHAPSNDRNRAQEGARSVTATIDGDRLVVNNVRDFNWRGDTDFDQRWEQRAYSLSHLAKVDLIMFCWGNEVIAHTIVSFGFDDGTRLAFSILGFVLLAGSR